MYGYSGDLLAPDSSIGGASRPRRDRLGSRGELWLGHAARQGRSVNNFDVLRLVGATLVMVAHSLHVTTGTPVVVLHESLGEIGVIIFFSISGFLVARSWAYDPQPLAFAAKRALRLMPALVVSLVLTALVLGPLTTALPLSTYLQHPGTKAYVLNNATFQWNLELPGVFANTPYPSMVNGSLWTLPLEVKAYCVVLVLGLLGLFGRWRLLMPLVALFFALLTIGSLHNALPLGDRTIATMIELQAPPGIMAEARAGAYLEASQLFAAFAIGAALFAVARWVPLRWSVAGLLVVAWAVAVALRGAQAVPVAAPLLLPYVVLLLGYRTSHLVRLPQRLGDYSYGIYIYSFPIQQAVVQWLAPSQGWITFVVSAPIVLALAVASWHFVEAPALTLKQRIRQPLERAGTAAAAQPFERAALQPDAPAPPVSAEDARDAAGGRAGLGDDPRDRIVPPGVGAHYEPATES
jgi:peptidoglycan/LPS O-acetylase OafA/YrhL